MVLKSMESIYLLCTIVCISNYGFLLSMCRAYHHSILMWLFQLTERHTYDSDSDKKLMCFRLLSALRAVTAQSQWPHHFWGTPEFKQNLNFTLNILYYCANNMPTTCQQHDNNMPTTWQQHVNNMPTTWQQHVNNMTTTWQQHDH